MKTVPTHILFALLLSSSLLISRPDAVADEITVAAANSICADLKTAGTIFTQQHKSKIKYICKSSGILAKGIQGGAIAADYFISASNKWMTSLVDGGLIDPPTVKSLWGNRIVAGAAKNSTIDLQNWDELATPEVGTILVGDPSTTPLGRRFKDVMMERGLWLKIRHKINAKRHITLIHDALLSAGPTTIGIIFVTTIDDSLKLVLDMPEKWNATMRYSGAPLIGTKNKEGVAFFETFLSSATTNEVFARKGYQILP